MEAFGRAEGKKGETGHLFFGLRVLWQSGGKKG
jgi:hypothetical protein